MKKEEIKNKFCEWLLNFYKENNYTPNCKNLKKLGSPYTITYIKKISGFTYNEILKELNIPINKSRDGGLFTFNCQFCNKESSKIHSRVQNNNFCSRSCAAKYNNKLKPKRTKKKCIICNSQVISCKHSRCKEHQKEYLSNKFEAIRDLTLQDYWSKKSLENLHTSSKNAHLRLLAKNDLKYLTKLPCANCKYNKHVELCHIKPIRDFLPTDRVRDVNSKDNIIQLCPNCHWEFDNGFIDISVIKSLQYESNIHVSN